MADIVDLGEFRSEHLELRVFGPWKKRFGKSFAKETSLEDLSDKVLLYLAQPGEEGTHAIYEFAMGVMDLGPGNKFDYLEKAQQYAVMEIHLFLADLFRFEMMRRLGWLEPLSCAGRSLIELVGQFDRRKNFWRETPPVLSKMHPDHSCYMQLHERDREGFIRRLLPGALEIFKRKIGI